MGRPTEDEIERWLSEDEQAFRRLIIDPEHDEKVGLEAERLRIRREASQLVDQEAASRDFVVPPATLTLAHELNIKDPPLVYTVDELHPRGGNTLLGAAFKAGKTTMLANLLRSLTDEKVFLGNHTTRRAPGRVAFWNYEVDGRQFRHWLRTVGITGLDEASVWNLRGYRLPLGVKYVEDLAVQWLEERGVSTLIVDPFSRAYSGEENNNTDVGRFLEALDVIKQRAGVTDLFMSAHFGRAEQDEGAERVRGATRLDDWADVRWVLTKNKEGDRYFYADGRDVSIEERRLSFDPSTLALTIAGGSRRDDRQAKQTRDDLEAVYAACTAEPGIGTTDLRSKLTGKNERRDKAVKAALNAGWIKAKREGSAVRHYPNPERYESAGGGR